MSEKEFLKQMGDKIKTVMKQRGIGGERLAKLCEMDYSNISRLKNGRKNCKVASLKKIADVLQVEVKDFF